MIILLSPAKTMNLRHPKETFNCLYKDDAIKLRTPLTSMSIKSLMTFFNISKDVALKTKSYFLDTHTYLVYNLFDGIGYSILKQLSPNIPKRIYALSGLYGLLSMSDTVYPYRLDLTHPKKGSLVSFWKKKLYEALKDENIIISCLSYEYEVLLDEKLLVIKVEIMKGTKKAPSVDAKKVRAAFAAFLEQCELDKITQFSFEGYKCQSFQDHKIILHQHH